MLETEKRYDVALSFSGRDRRFAKRLAEELGQRGISVFYDKYEQANLWGKNLYDHLDAVYSRQSRYCVIIVSRHYADGVWTNHERKAAQAKALADNEEYILPVRVDETVLPGLSSTIAYLDVREFGPKRIAVLLARKLGKSDGGTYRTHPFNLRWIDGLALCPEYRAVLRPGELMPDRSRRMRRLPRFFYEIPGWKDALDIGFTPNYGIWEFLNVDVREHEANRSLWPRYIPCASYDLALHLETLRAEFQAHIYIAANGGYRTPAHQLSTHASTHCWGTAVNIYRIGDDWLDSREVIEHYSQRIISFVPRLWVRPYGHGVAEADDHIHIDLGYSTMVPSGAPGEETNGPEAEA